MMIQDARYIPALSYGSLTPLYDPLLKLVMREDTLKRRLVAQANLQPEMRVLDVGCGTGTLTVMLAKMQRDARIVGLDGDPRVLNLAQAKSAKAGLAIPWTQGLAFHLPYADDAFDRVVASLVLHHLTRANKLRTFMELVRVLRPGGELHILDFGVPHNVMMGVVAQGMRHLEETTDHFDGLLPDLLRESGFGYVEETDHFSTVFGPLSLYRALKASEENES